MGPSLVSTEDASKNASTPEAQSSIFDEISQSTQRLHKDAKVVSLQKEMREHPLPTPRYTPQLKYIDLDLAARFGAPRLPWMIEPWIAKGDILCLAGEAGVGKSTLSASLAVALASGSPWLGCSNPTPPGPILYFDEEAGPDETSRLFLKFGGNGISNLHISSCDGVNLANPQCLTQMEQDIANIRPICVFLDTVTQCFGLKDENSSVEVAQRYQTLIRWRKMYQCAFVVLHHLRKNPNGYSRSSALDRIRGSSVFSTQSSVVWGAERMDDDTMKVSVEKRRGSSRRGVAHVRYSEQDDKIFLYRI